ncbi:MAG: insulinase family protein, partial [Bacteroidales bacterium]|nr:insulinase family protein [Bacteroidales bacterium]
MKKMYWLLLGFVLVTQISAQKYDPNAIVPTDPGVKIGKLDNGLTYYIRKNNKPENRADMYILHHVGAILEEDSQNGLAHFTEHMAFKGTTHFPGDAITKYCEKNGIKFGANLNAYTSIDRTCYMLSSIPLERESLIDSLLLILHDWSGEFLFKPEMLEIERGVIREEWRTYGGSGFRISEQLRPVIYNHSQYAKRNVIGDINVLNTFKMNDILDFYHKWYRPDLQALILIGDFDPDQMEEKVKKLFKNRPKPQNSIQLPEYEIPDNDGILIGSATDPEAGNLSISLMYKHEGTRPENRDKQKFMWDNRVTRLINTMLSSRMDELYLKDNQPFASIYGGYYSWLANKDVFSASVRPKNNQAPQAFKVLLTELERVKRYGFNESELERAKATILNGEQRAYNERNNRDNGAFLNLYISHFTGNNSIPSVEYTYNFTQNVLPMITLEEINRKAQNFFPDKNIIVTQSVSDKDKDQMLTEDMIKKMLADIKKENIEPYKDEMSGKQLMEQLPQKGKIIKTKTLKKPFNAVEWTLSNGAKVVIYPTTHKEDQIILSAYSWGGSSLISDQDYQSSRYATSIPSLSGIGDFSFTDLNKLLAGKSAYANL